MWNPFQVECDRIYEYWTEPRYMVNWTNHMFTAEGTKKIVYVYSSFIYYVPITEQWIMCFSVNLVVGNAFP